MSDGRIFTALGLAVVGLFITCCGFGMTSPAIGGLGIVIGVLGPGLIVLSSMRENVREYVYGSAHVHSASPPPVAGASGRCDMHLLVHAHGVNGVVVRVRDPAVPTSKWPDTGATLPVVIPNGNPRRTQVLWDQVRTHADIAAAGDAYADDYDPYTADESVLVEEYGAGLAVDETFTGATAEAPAPAPAPATATADAPADADADAPADADADADATVGHAEAEAAASEFEVPAQRVETPDGDAVTDVTGSAPSGAKPRRPSPRPRRTPGLDADGTDAVAAATPAPSPPASPPPAAPAPTPAGETPRVVELLVSPVARKAPSTGSKPAPDPEAEPATGAPAGDTPGQPSAQTPSTPSPRQAPKLAQQAPPDPAAKAGKPRKPAHPARPATAAVDHGGEDTTTGRSAETNGTAPDAEPTRPVPAKDGTFTASYLADNPRLAAAPAVDQRVHGVSVTLVVKNLERSLAFYRDIVGLTEIDTGPGSAVLASGTARVLLRSVTDMQPVDRRIVHLNLEVDDVHAEYERLRAAGVEFAHRPRVVSQGEQLEQWAATFRDPDGHAISITRWEIRD